MLARLALAFFHHILYLYVPLICLDRFKNSMKLAGQEI